MRKKVKLGERQNRWWDGECREERKKLRENLRKLVEDGEGRRKYFKSKKEYEEMIERKKQEEGQRVLKRIVEDKTGKTFWEEVNKGRKRREGVDESIMEEKWRRHFREYLGGQERSKVLELGIEGGEVQEEDGEITVSEV